MLTCTRCQQLIEAPGSQRSAHMHHDALECTYSLDERLCDLSQNLPDDYDDDFDDLLHVITCQYIVVYHDDCCPLCQFRMAVV